MEGIISRLYVSNFINESNSIEGISFIRRGEQSAYEKFLSLEVIDIEDLIKLLNVIQPHARLRNQKGLDVKVGKHYPPKGSKDIEFKLECVLKAVRASREPYIVHNEYEMLHPFTDGNGRTGRALWLWQMVNQHKYDGSLKFLHRYYYQSLDNFRS